MNKLTIRRIGAFCIDWYLSGILCGLSIQLSLFIFGDLKEFNLFRVQLIEEMDLTVIILANLLTLLFFFAYFVILPLRRKDINYGNTIGYGVFRLKILYNGNQKISWKVLLFRNYICLFASQIILTCYEGQFRVLINKLIGVRIYNIIFTVLAINTIISLLLYLFKNNRSLSDIMSKVRVVVQNK